jgi:hypothetical protein
VEAKVRETLLTVMELLMEAEKRLNEVELRCRALQIVLAKATGYDLESAELSLQKLVDSLRSEKLDEANQEALTIIQFLRAGKNPSEPDA